MGALTGKTAIVTGANRGIGRAIAKRLASDGASVVICARDRTLLDETLQEIGSGRAIALDLRLPESAQALMDFAHTADILINNAGATKRGEFELLSEEDWVDGFALKFFAAVRLTRAAWPHLKQNSGSVVNVAGSGGRTPGAQFAIGGSVNAAMLSFTKSLAETGIADRVQVNAVNPGPVRTERLARRLIQESVDAETFARLANITRIGEPEDIANLVAFIVSPAGRLLHGALIDIDGGQTKTI